MSSCTHFLHSHKNISYLFSLILSLLAFCHHHSVLSGVIALLVMDVVSGSQVLGCGLGTGPWKTSYQKLGITVVHDLCAVCLVWSKHSSFQLRWRTSGIRTIYYLFVRGGSVRPSFMALHESPWTVSWMFCCVNKDKRWTQLKSNERKNFFISCLVSAETDLSRWSFITAGQNKPSSSLRPNTTCVSQRILNMGSAYNWPVTADCWSDKFFSYTWRSPGEAFHD